MEFTAFDDAHLQRALHLAEHCAAFASPNPTVGCVLTRDSCIVGEGAHRYDKRDHAEIVALHSVQSKGLASAAATAYVTLEPCAHHGRTGPCADALIAAGIVRCLIATIDPNPQVRSKGVRRMRAAGIQVDVLPSSHPLAIRARRQNDAFAFSITQRRPFVTLKSALSVDGRLAPHPSARVSGAPHWLTGVAARADVQRLRHTSDAIVTGIGTVLADDPALTDRTGLPRRRPLLRVVLDTNLRLPIESALVRTAADDVLVLHASSANPEKVRALQEHAVATFALGPSGPRPEDALAHLHAQGIRSVLLEAGPTLIGAFLRADLIDSAVLYFSEAELGPNAFPFSSDGTSPFSLVEKFTNVSRETFPHGAAQDVRIAGLLRDPWPR